jgi:hypothetical protein
MAMLEPSPSNETQRLLIEAYTGMGWRVPERALRGAGGHQEAAERPWDDKGTPATGIVTFRPQPRTVPRPIGRDTLARTSRPGTEIAWHRRLLEQVDTFGTRREHLRADGP